LAIACERGDIKVVKLLLRLGANVEARDEDDNTPLLLAVKKGQGETAGLLIKKGANVHVNDIDGCTVALAGKGLAQVDEAMTPKDDKSSTEDLATTMSICI
jgi:ankyrin repeat protein